jgi:hypothetical protein
MDTSERDARLKASAEHLAKFMDQFEKNEISKEDYAAELIKITSAEIRESEELAIAMEAESKYLRSYAENLKRGLAMLGVK